MRRSATCLLVAGIGILAASRALAQENTAAPDTTATLVGVPSAPMASTAATPWYRPAFIGLRVATAWHSPFPTRTGTPAYRDFYTVDLRAGWTIAASEDATLEYTPSITPLAITTGNPEYVPDTRPCKDGYCTMEQRMVPVYRTVYAAGLAPLGFQLRFFPHAPVRPFAHLSGGALWFTRPIPDPMATRFNFTAETGGGLEIALPRRHALTIGYAFHHTSNGGTGQVNPGMNSGVLIVGVTAGR
jgi:hypothetical protein